MAKEEKEDKGITVKKDADFSEWYTQVVQKAELADYGPVQGTIAYRPTAYAIWENIQGAFNTMLKSTGHRNVYFPLLIPENLLTKEKEHVEGFAPEVFWVTHSGDNKLPERLAIRPTSETVIYSFYSRWVRSWRDLPLLLNQWCNILRAEIKSTKPFIRGSEFLWQEGHTVHATKEEADKEVMQMLDFYKELIEQYLAIPAIIGTKSEREKFAGALYTTTVELMMPDGKALQGGTSHNLGQNFSKPFKITFLDKDGSSKYAWTTSWGISTRLIGATIMVHGDDKGLVLPPRIAPVKVVIVPIYKAEEKKEVVEKAESIRTLLGQFEISTILDDSEGRSPGWKFSEHEKNGIPIRIEIGPKDIKQKQVVLVRRDNGQKVSVAENDVKNTVLRLLDTIQNSMLGKAKAALGKLTTEVDSYPSFKSTIDKKGGFVVAGWCGADECEVKIKDETGASIRAIPFEQPRKLGACVACGKKAKHTVYFARAY